MKCLGWRPISTEFDTLRPGQRSACMKRLIFLWIVLLLPSFCQAQPVPPVTSVEVGSDPEVFDSKNVHERAQNKGAYNLRVRYLKVEGRWAGQVELPLK